MREPSRTADAFTWQQFQIYGDIDAKFARTATLECKAGENSQACLPSQTRAPSGKYSMCAGLDHEPRGSCTAGRDGLTDSSAAVLQAHPASPGAPANGPAWKGNDAPEGALRP